MASRSPSRGRYRSRSRSLSAGRGDPPSSARRRRHDSRSVSRSPAPLPRRNGRHSSQSRSWSRGRGRDGGEASGPPPSGTKVVVERLTKNVMEEHIHEIFGRFGPIQDLDLPISRISGTNRGTTYLLFDHRADAEVAVSNMHEGTIDGAVIHASIVLPRRMFSPGPPTARRGANIDPRVPPAGPRGGRGPRAYPPGGGYYAGGPGGGGRRRPSPPGRYGSRPYAHQPSLRSRSRSGSPPRGPRSRGGGSRYRSRSYGSYSSRSRSKSPPPRGGGAGRYGDGMRRRSRSRSYDGYAGHDGSDSRQRGYR